MPTKKPLKLDAINRKILATIHLQSDITNAKLAEIVNLSPAACSQRTNALKEAGYYFNAHAEVDLSKAVLHTAAALDSALSAWRSRIAPITNSPNAGVEVKFYAGIQTMQAFHQRVRAMGIETLPEGSPTEGAVGVVAPYVTFGGDPAQPCAFVLWRLAPEEKTTLQWNSRKFYVSARGKKGHIEPRIETLVTFFGPPVAVSSSAAR